MRDVTPISSPAPPNQTGREGAAERLQRLWRQGERPDVGAFLAPAGPLSPGEVAAVLHLDQRERSVGRKLRVIRALWAEEAADDGQAGGGH